MSYGQLAKIVNNRVVLPSCPAMKGNKEILAPDLTVRMELTRVNKDWFWRANVAIIRSLLLTRFQRNYITWIEQLFFIPLLLIFFGSGDQDHYRHRFGVKLIVLHCPSWGFYTRLKTGHSLGVPSAQRTLWAKGTKTMLTLQCASARKCTSLNQSFSSCILWTKINFVVGWRERVESVGPVWWHHVVVCRKHMIDKPHELRHF